MSQTEDQKSETEEEPKTLAETHAVAATNAPAKPKINKPLVENASYDALADRLNFKTLG